MHITELTYPNYTYNDGPQSLGEVALLTGFHIASATHFLLSCYPLRSYDFHVFWFYNRRRIISSGRHFHKAMSTCLTFHKVVSTPQNKMTIEKDLFLTFMPILLPPFHQEWVGVDPTSSKTNY